MTQRFYYESDGGNLEGLAGQKTHYVIDRYADPLGDQRRTDCTSRLDALRVADRFNDLPPWKPWDEIQARRDGYVS